MKSKTIKKKYVMIVTEETDLYPKVGLSYFADAPWAGDLTDVITGDTRDELFSGAVDVDGETYEGLFYQLFETETGRRLEYGVFDPDSFEWMD